MNIPAGDVPIVGIFLKEGGIALSVDPMPPILE